MSDHEAKSSVVSTLREHGFSAEEIPTAEIQTPDIRCSDGKLEYLIEIKEKTLDGEKGADRVTDSGYVRRDPLIRSNVVSRITRKAARQLVALGDPGPVKIMWYFPAFPHSKYLLKQLRYSVYGIRIACIRLASGGSDVRECYYADHSDFFRQRTMIDGIVVGSLRILLLNDCSSRCDILRSSKLARLASYIEDPPQVEADGKALYLHSAVDRADVEAVKKELGDQYGCKVTDMTNFVRFSAFMHGS